MSNANKPTKVLRVAYRRLEKAWTKSKWVHRNKQTGVTEVCIEGAIFGFKDAQGNTNPACVMARDLVLEIIQEKYKDEYGRPKYRSVPSFNDAEETTHEMVLEVTKLALIRAETGGLLRKTEEECYEPKGKLTMESLKTKRWF